MKTNNWLICAAVLGLMGGIPEKSYALGAEPPVAKVPADTVQAPNPMAVYFPEKARKSKISGVVVVSCAVREDSHFEACQIVREAPTSYDFGAATLKMVNDIGRADLKLNKPGDIVRATINWNYTPEPAVVGKGHTTHKHHSRIRRH